MAVRSRAAWRDLHDLDAGVGEDGVERGGELASPVADQEPEVVGPFVEVHEQVAGLLGGPCPVGVRGGAEDVDVTGGDLHHEEDVDPFEGGRAVDVEEIAGQHARGFSS